MKFLRRIRGALGMGLTWGIAWFIPGFIPRWVLGMDGDLPFPILFFGLGFVAGVTFSALLALTEGRRRLDQMSIPRIAAWGAAGGLVLSALFVRGVPYSLVQVLGISTTLVLASAACASGSLLLARRAAMRELPDTGDLEVDELADVKAQKLL